MNKELFRLARQGLGRRRKDSLLLFAVLCLSFACAIVTLSVSGSIGATNQAYRLDIYGEWWGSISNAAASDIDFLEDQEWLRALGTSQTYGETVGGATACSIGVLDDGFIRLGHIGLQDGRMPEAVNEIAMEAGKLSALGYDYTLGQEIELAISLPTQEDDTPPVIVTHRFTLCGVLKAYSDFWGSAFSRIGELNGAVFTGDTGTLLLEEARAEARRMEAEEGVKMSLEGPSLQLFFYVEKELSGEAQKEIDTWLGRERPGMIRNDFSYENVEETRFHALYTVLIFLVTILAVLCIYTIQLQKQVRQYALFRSIGITKRQLRRIVFYESMILCVPAAVFGALFGAAGTWAVLRLVMYSGSAPVKVAVPWLGLLLIFLAWLGGLVLIRMAVLQLALREPLTGRVTMESKKLRRYRILRRAMISLMSLLLCASCLFTVLEALAPMEKIQFYGDNFDYTLNFTENMISLKHPVLSKEFLNRVNELPGVIEQEVMCGLAAELRFDGMENSSMYLDQRDGMEKTYEWNPREHTYSPNALAVRINAVEDDALRKQFDVKALGLDLDAFHRGEQVILIVEKDVTGEYMNWYPLFGDTEQVSGMSNEIHHHRDAGVKPGDKLDLTVFGYPPGSRADMDPETGREVTPLWEFEPEAVIAEMEYEEAVSYGTYGIYCSYSYLEKAFSQMPEGYETFNLCTGEEFGYSRALVYTNAVASYLSTDTVIAQLCVEEGCTLFSTREFNQAHKQEYGQTLILLVSVGGCLGAVLILLLINALVLEAAREQKTYSILRSLGMSRRQLLKRLWGSALLRGVISTLFGWASYGVWLLIKARFTLAEELAQQQWMQTFFDYSSALNSVIHDLLADGLNIPLALILTAAPVALITALSLLAKRSLLGADLMKKLRDE